MNNELAEMLRFDQPITLPAAVAGLLQAAKILCEQHNYDGHGHEVLNAYMATAAEWLRSLERQNLWAPHESSRRAAPLRPKGAMTVAELSKRLKPALEHPKMPVVCYDGRELRGAYWRRDYNPDHRRLHDVFVLSLYGPDGR